MVHDSRDPVEQRLEDMRFDDAPAAAHRERLVQRVVAARRARLDGISHAQPRVGRVLVPRWQWAAIAGGAVAAMVLAGVWLRGRGPSAMAPPHPLLADVSPAHILPAEQLNHSQETNPCNVLPPLL